ncbi:AAA ATPase [hydrothermal vent metagenome]|uniref:AAA ATPase n=1 Tax=hydrothermal vent metagenome TaxID=652676 RepID=A0A3B0TF42_9ZZZZ
MIKRNLQKKLLKLLQSNAAVVLIGPRQVGKTTLSLEVTAELNAVYRDLENPRELEQVRDIELFMKQYPDRLVILDEVQRVPDIFAPLRGIIDQRRRAGFRFGQFLFLGSSSLELLSQASESLAGRVAYCELTGLNILEIQAAKNVSISSDDLWVKGGFPESLTAKDNSISQQWRRDLIRSYLERDIPQFGFRVPSETMRRFWTMLAHHQGGILNASSLAASLGISGQSVARYLDILVDLLLVRRLQPWFANVGKRLVKSPKIYIRDSGLLHSLLDIPSMDALLGHPVLGASWEGFVIENLIGASGGEYGEPCFYRTQAGAEIDLLMTRGGQPEIAIEIKRASNPKVGKGFHIACDDLGIKHRYVVYPGDEAYAMPNDIWAMPLQEMIITLQSRKNYSFSPKFG